MKYITANAARFSTCVCGHFIDKRFITFYEVLHSNIKRTALISPSQYYEKARTLVIKKYTNINLLLKGKKTSSHFPAIKLLTCFEANYSTFIIFLMNYFEDLFNVISI